MTELELRAALEATDPLPGDAPREGTHGYFYAEGWADRRLAIEAETATPDAGLRAALLAVSWNEVGGPCWCRESPEKTGFHEAICKQAREALAAAPSPAPLTAADLWGNPNRAERMRDSLPHGDWNIASGRCKTCGEPYPCLASEQPTNGEER